MDLGIGISTVNPAKGIILLEQNGWGTFDPCVDYVHPHRTEGN